MILMSTCCMHRHLDETAAALRGNIADKDATDALEDRCALLDGRTSAAVPPTPSLLNVRHLMVMACQPLCL